MRDETSCPSGGRPMGRLVDAPPLSRLFVWAMRHWLFDARSQEHVWNHFAGRLGGETGRAAMTLFEAHLFAIAKNTRRTLCRRPPACACLGADEAVMGRLVERAARGEVGGAYAEAAFLVHGAGAFEAVETATRFGPYALKIGDAPEAAVARLDPRLSAAISPTRH